MFCTATRPIFIFLVIVILTATHVSAAVLNHRELQGYS